MAVVARLAVIAEVAGLAVIAEADPKYGLRTSYRVAEPFPQVWCPEQHTETEHQTTECEWTYEKFKHNCNAFAFYILTGQDWKSSGRVTGPISAAGFCFQFAYPYGTGEGFMRGGTKKLPLTDAVREVLPTDSDDLLEHLVLEKAATNVVVLDEEEKSLVGENTFMLGDYIKDRYKIAVFMYPLKALCSMGLCHHAGLILHDTEENNFATMTQSRMLMDVAENSGSQTLGVVSPERFVSFEYLKNAVEPECNAASLETENTPSSVPCAKIHERMWQKFDVAIGSLQEDGVESAWHFVDAEMHARIRQMFAGPGDSTRAERKVSISFFTPSSRNDFNKNENMMDYLEKTVGRRRQQINKGDKPKPNLPRVVEQISKFMYKANEISQKMIFSQKNVDALYDALSFDRLKGVYGGESTNAGAFMRVAYDRSNGLLVEPELAQDKPHLQLPMPNESGEDTNLPHPVKQAIEEGLNGGTVTSGSAESSETRSEKLEALKAAAEAIDPNSYLLTFLKEQYPELN